MTKPEIIAALLHETRSFSFTRKTLFELHEAMRDADVYDLAQGTLLYVRGLVDTAQKIAMFEFSAAASELSSAASGSDDPQDPDETLQ